MPGWPHAECTHSSASRLVLLQGRNPAGLVAVGGLPLSSTARARGLGGGVGQGAA